MTENKEPKLKSWEEYEEELDIKKRIFSAKERVVLSEEEIKKKVQEEKTKLKDRGENQPRA